MKKVVFKALLCSVVFGLSSTFFHFIAVKLDINTIIQRPSSKYVQKSLLKAEQRKKQKNVRSEQSPIIIESGSFRKISK